MNVVAGLGGFLIYYINKLNFDPILLGLLIEQVGAFLVIAYKWIKYNFQLPEDTSNPVVATNMVSINPNEWEYLQTTSEDGKLQEYWVKKV